MNLSDEEKQTLLRVARNSIEHGVETGEIMEVDQDLYSASLREEKAVFVTLKRLGKLRGCIGVIEASSSLVAEVAYCAYCAAFRDFRFGPVRAHELEGLDIRISILTPSERIHFTSQADLLRQLRPGVDGLTLHDGNHRGSFLPVMWGEIPTPEEFLKHLKIKAGLPPDFWSDAVEVFRFTAETVP